MLTSPAADDYNPWQAFRPINRCDRNNARYSDFRPDDKRTVSSESGETRTMQLQDGNVNANTCGRQIGLLAENYDRDIQEYHEEIQVKQEEVGDKRIECVNDRLFEEGRKGFTLTSNWQKEHEASVQTNLFKMNLSNENIPNTDLYGNPMHSLQYPKAFHGASNMVSMSDTCISVMKKTNQDNRYSAFRRVCYSNKCEDISVDFDKTGHLQNNRNGNYFDDKYSTDKQYQGKLLECCEGELLESVPHNALSEENNVIDSFSVYREHDDIEDEYTDFRKSTASIANFCSVSSEEMEEYEVIEWDQHENDDISNQLRTSKTYLTPTTSPVQDLSGLDGFRTAPSTPELAENEPKFVEGGIQLYDNDIEDLMDEFFVITDHDRPSIKYDTSEEVEVSEELQGGRGKETGDKIGDDDGKVKTKDSEVKEAKHCCKCGKAIKAASTAPSSENVNASDNNVPKVTNQTGHTNVEPTTEQHQSIQRRESSRLQLQTPPFISVDSLYYEADPETGTAKVIGRGSFGQVYKARFSDPNFYHLPIVVKEFNEEFSNSRDIVEEAQRLYYLQDTGYVPVCYGLLCFSDSNRPKYGIVQEYIGTGLTLEQILWDQYQFPLEVWLSISFQCCEGLARFHERGIVLNDIKTNNILLEFRHNSVKIKFIDFGLATDMRGKRYKNTKSLESYVYLAPEVRKYGNWTNIASDIYSLGYMLGQLYNYTGLHVLDLVSRLCTDRDPDMRLPVQGALSLIHDGIIKHGFDPGTLCLNLR